MNKADYSYLQAEIAKATEYIAFYERMNDDNFTKDIYFWKGYLNAVHLHFLQAKHGYKLDK